VAWPPGARRSRGPSPAAAVRAAVPGPESRPFGDPGGSGTVPVRRGSCGGLRPPSCGWAGRVPTGGAVPSVVGRHPARRGGRSLPSSRERVRSGSRGAPFSVPVGGRRCPEGVPSVVRVVDLRRSVPARRLRFIPRLAWCHGWRAGGSRVSWALSALSARQGGSRSGGSVGAPRTGGREFGWDHPHFPRRSGLPVWSPVSGSGGRPGGVHSLHGSSLGSHGAADPVSFFLVRGPHAIVGDRVSWVGVAGVGRVRPPFLGPLSGDYNGMEAGSVLGGGRVRRAR